MGRGAGAILYFGSNAAFFFLNITWTDPLRVLGRLQYCLIRLGRVLKENLGCLPDYKCIGTIYDVLSKTLLIKSLITLVWYAFTGMIGCLDEHWLEIA